MSKDKEQGQEESGTWVVVAEGPAHLDKRNWLTHAVLFVGTSTEEAHIAFKKANNGEAVIAGWFHKKNEDPKLMWVS